MVSDVLVRPAVAEDAAAVLEHWAALFAEDAGNRDSTIDVAWPRLHGERWFAEGIGDDSKLWLVAVVGGEVVGFLAGGISGPVEIRPVAVATLRSMYVVPRARGKRVGAGLVSGFIEWGAQRGAGRLAVDAFAANRRAVAFYQRMGFVPHTVTLELDPALRAG